MDRRSIDLGLSIVLWIEFDPHTADFQFVERANWVTLGGFTISYHLGIDGISLFFVLLSALLTLLSVASGWVVIQYRVKEYMVAFLVLETLMVGMFCALDFVVFYVFFEGVLVPMFLIIGVWGGPRRVYSAFKFFLYTLLGSVLMLLAVIAVYYRTGTTDIVYALQHAELFPPLLQRWLWLAFFASFAVKVPMWPVHTWLPDAHVEAPTAGSVILAGILLKMGGYGFLRFSLPMFPLASQFFTPLIFTLSAIAVIYTSLVALAQTDMKKLVAYSSIAHMGFVTMGTFAMTSEAVRGALIQMLSHGLVSAALFLCVGVLYDRLHTHEIARFGGLIERMPAYAFVFMVFMLASVGLPGTSGFVGEFLILLGTFRVSTLGSRPRGDCAVPRSRLHALSLSPGDIRRDHSRRSARHARSQSARDRGLRAAARPGAVDGRLSEFVSAADWRFGRSPGDAGECRRRGRRHARRQAALAAPRCSASLSPVSRRRCRRWCSPAPRWRSWSWACCAAKARPGSSRGWRSRCCCWFSSSPMPRAAARRVGFYGMFVADAFGVFMKTLVLAGSAVTILMALRFNEDAGIARFEFPVLVLLATTGMMMMVSANDLITLYVGLELQNLALYVVASFDRDSTRSSEAGLKYFVLGGLSSGMLLYGISLVYGFAGTTGFAEIGKLVAAGAPAATGVLIGLVFIVVGLAFKISAVPFHMWTPDVYEGAPTPVSAFFSVAPKMAAFALFIRVMVAPFGALAGEWRQVVVFLSIASMVLGAVAAIAQHNIKRLMAYSSIGHVGYALIGLAAGSASGVRGATGSAACWSIWRSTCS